MPRLNPVRPETTPPKVQRQLDAVQRALGVTPNMFKTMANAPAVLGGYLAFNDALGLGVLNAKTREQIALAVAEQNGCDYCASAHSVLGRSAGLTDAEITGSLEGRGRDAKSNAVLGLARKILASRGDVSDADLARARAAGLSDVEIAETVANVSLNVLTNYFNNLSQPDIDFPHVTVSQGR